MVWMNLACVVWLSRIVVKSLSSMRMVTGLKNEPTGSCIQALATRMRKADIFAPMAISVVTARCPTFERRSQPKKNSPTMVDSRKKASMPSIASGAPKISPT